MCIKNYILPFDIFCSVSSLIDCNNNKIVCVFFSVDCRVSSINSLKNVLKLFLSILSVFFLFHFPYSIIFKIY